MEDFHVGHFTLAFSFPFNQYLFLALPPSYNVHVWKSYKSTKEQSWK